MLVRRSAGPDRQDRRPDRAARRLPGRVPQPRPGDRDHPHRGRAQAGADGGILAFRPPGRSDPQHAPAQLAQARGNGDRASEREALAKERDELVKLVESPARQRTRLKRDLAALRTKFGDERRTRIEEVAAAREIDWSAMIEKEPITVILSQRGWIRAMKGHLALDQVADLKWREGDGPFIHFHAQTTDRLALFASNGRVYTLAGDKLPSARGFGEPVRLFIDLEAEVDIVQLLVARPEMKLLIASSRRQRLRHQRRSDACRDPQGQAAGQCSRRSAGRGRSRPIGEGGRCGRGGWREPQDAGVSAGRAARARARAGGHPAALPRRRPSDAVAFAFGRGAELGAWRRDRADPDRDRSLPWRAARGAAGRMPPIGFPRSNRFD